MANRHAELLFDSPHVQVGNVVCREQRSGPSPKEWTQTPEIVLPRRGVFCVHRSKEHIVADANTAVLFGADGEYCVSHPVNGGEECTVLVFPLDVLEDALVGDTDGGRAWHHAGLSPPTQLAAAALATALRRGVVDPLEAEESGLRLLNAVAGDLVPVAHERQGGARRPQAARSVEDTRLQLASAPSHPWRLADVARALHYSPFHLARLFRATTGMGMHRYLVRLRLGLALDRLAQGECDLATLATDLGFAHHSHFTASFRSVFGTTPAAARERLTRAQLREMRTILTAAGLRGPLD